MKAMRVLMDRARISETSVNSFLTTQKITIFMLVTVEPEVSLDNSVSDGQMSRNPLTVKSYFYPG